MKKLRTACLAASMVASVAATAPASAATIVLNGLDSVTNLGARNGYQAAANYWANMLTNDVTIVFNVAFASLDPGVLGSTGSFAGNVRASTVYNGLVNRAQSALDAQAVASVGAQLAAGGGFALNALVTSVEDGSTFSDTNRSFNNQILYANSSVLKALGLTTYAGPDANITFSSDFAFDFDPTDGITAGASDFVGVAVHEMGHGLGFVSGVDYYDIIQCPDGPVCGALSDTDMENDSWMSVMDMFRYSSAGQLDWTVGTPSYFSIDNGLSEFNGAAKLSSGSFNGDGWQASHWQAPRNSAGNFTCAKTNRLGIMNPFLCSGQAGDVEGLDLAAFDAMGWNTRVDVLANPNYAMSSADIFNQFAPVPEPSTWAMLILGFGFLGGALRRRGKSQLSFA